MSLFNNFPWTNFHELNLDWLVKKVASLEAAFPEGTIGISKGGTGADNAADARENLGINAANIPMSEGGASTLAQEITRLGDNINSLSSDIRYRIFRVVSDLGLTSGAATLSSCWAAMSTGDILIAPPSEFAFGQMPENTGSLVMVRNDGTSGSLRFYGNRTYEQVFINNYPSGIWRTILNDTDIIPISKGGTGATNAADARAALGIDFSGTVLSVANVGADTAGNVPLTAADLDVKITVYTSITDPDIGLPTGSSISAVWNALAANSRVVFPSSEVSNPPEESPGVIDICKTGPNNNLGWIMYHAQRQSVGDYQMFLTSSSVPSGTWEKMGAVETVDLTSQCTFPKGAPAHVYALKTGKMVQVFYQGPSTTYTAGDILMTLPINLDTAITSQVLAPCVLDNVAYGTVVLNGNQISINQIVAASGTHRIYFQIAFPSST